MTEYRCWLDIQYDKDNPEEMYQIPVCLSLPRFPVAGDHLFIMDEETPDKTDISCWEMTVTKIQFSHGESNVTVRPEVSTEQWSMKDCERLEAAIQCFSDEYGARLIRYRQAPIVL